MKVANHPFRRTDAGPTTGRTHSTVSHALGRKNPRPPGTFTGWKPSSGNPPPAPRGKSASLPPQRAGTPALPQHETSGITSPSQAWVSSSGVEGVGQGDHQLHLTELGNLPSVSGFRASHVSGEPEKRGPTSSNQQQQRRCYPASDTGLLQGAGYYIRSLIPAHYPIM